MNFAKERGSAVRAAPVEGFLNKSKWSYFCGFYRLVVWLEFWVAKQKYPTCVFKKWKMEKLSPVAIAESPCPSSSYHLKCVLQCDWQLYWFYKWWGCKCVFFCAQYPLGDQPASSFYFFFSFSWSWMWKDKKGEPWEGPLKHRGTWKKVKQTVVPKGNDMWVTARWNNNSSPTMNPNWPQMEILC